MYRVEPDDLPRLTNLRSLMKVCKQFYHRLQPFIYNVIIIPASIDSIHLGKITCEIREFRHPHWIRGLRLGNAIGTHPLLDSQTLAQLLFDLTSLEILHIDGPTTTSLLQPSTYHALSNLSKLSTLELFSPSQSFEIRKINKTICYLPQLKSLFLTCHNLIRPGKQSSPSTHLGHLPHPSSRHPLPPPLVNLVIKFLTNQSADLYSLVELLTLTAPTLRVLRLHGQLGAGLHAALTPVFANLNALELSKVNSMLEGVLDFTMAHLQILVLGAMHGFLPYFQWQRRLFPTLNSLALQNSANLRPATIEPFVDVNLLQKLILVDFVERGSEWPTPNSPTNDTISEWCLRHSIELQVMDRAQLLDKLFQSATEAITYVEGSHVQLSFLLTCQVLKPQRKKRYNTHLLADFDLLTVIFKKLCE